MEVDEGDLQFDVTPVPNVLIALTNTTIQPIDALCEIIDNSIDSFLRARNQGENIADPTIAITLPMPADISRGEGEVTITDNGPGMTYEQMQNAITAGYSSNNKFDTLGLFGLGFNIATGKLGNRTVVISSRRQDEDYLQTTIDLRNINSRRSYRLDVKKTLKDEESPFPPGAHGTIIKIGDWWPEGQANHDFIKKLAGISKPKVREAIGRRYATYLRRGDGNDTVVRIRINGEDCVAFEHCCWSSKRFVVRNGQNIPARFDFDEVLHTARTCTSCGAEVADSDLACPSCGSRKIRTIEERIHGWVGIQRFDDTDNYGIDLIRRGRAIRVAEKDAFFKFTDSLGNTVTDYPVDSTFGRIIGEVHMDAVPVDYMKQDFERSSTAWQRAISFLRGDSSLKPNQPGAGNNHSYIYKLYQGYRRVRQCGKADLYMGKYDPAEHKAKRISRATEREYYQKFLDGEPGFRDDSEWWKLVDEADQPPAPAFVICPRCQAQNLEEAEECIHCGFVLKPKKCISCGKDIPLSAITCQYCGASQIVEPIEPWVCEVCNTKNVGTDEICSNCGSPRGTQNPLSEEYLLAHSSRDDELSSTEIPVLLPNGMTAHTSSVDVFLTDGPIIDKLSARRYPLMEFKTIANANLFIDKSHPLFSLFGIPCEQIIAEEIAQIVLNANTSLMNYSASNITNISTEVLSAKWGEDLEISMDTVSQRVGAALSGVLSRMSASLGSAAGDYYEELDDTQKGTMTENMLHSDGGVLENLSFEIKSGDYLKYVPHDFILRMIALVPDKLFGGHVFKDSIGEIDDDLADLPAIKVAREFDRLRITNCLEDLIMFEKNQTADHTILRRAYLSAEYVEDVLVR